MTNETKTPISDTIAELRRLVDGRDDHWDATLAVLELRQLLDEADAAAKMRETLRKNRDTLRDFGSRYLPDFPDVAIAIHAEADDLEERHPELFGDDS